jgi:hypothetical protein
MNTLILISFMIFGTTILFLTGLYLYIRYVREHAQLIDKIDKGSSIPSMDLDSGGDVSPARQLRALFVKITGRLGELVKPKKEDEVANFQKPLARIGYRERTPR